MNFLWGNVAVFHANFIAVVERGRAAQGEQQHGRQAGLGLAAKTRGQARLVVVAEHVVGPGKGRQGGFHFIYRAAHGRGLPGFPHQTEVEGQVQFIAVLTVVTHPAVVLAPQFANGAAVVEFVQHGADLAQDGVHFVLIHVVAVDQAAVETGIRAILSFETTGRISEENAALGLEENVKFIEKARKRGGRVTGRIGVHTTYTCSTELLMEVKRKADELGVGYMMHHLDDRWHHMDTTLRFGKRPTRYLADIGFLSPNF